MSTDGCAPDPGESETGLPALSIDIQDIPTKGFLEVLFDSAALNKNAADC